MKKLLLMLGIALMGIVLAVGPNSIAIAAEEEEDEEGEGQEFLFMLEEAYLQEKGEWEVSFTTQYMDHKKSREIEYEDSEKEETLRIKDEWRWILGLEYGIFDWLTAELEIPFANVDKTTIKESDGTRTVTDLDKTGIGDIEVGVKIGLLEDEKDSWLPATSLGFEVSCPSGNWKKDLGTNHIGFEGGLAFSKTFERWAYHLNVGGGYTDDAKEEGETGKIDEVELECGAALVYMPYENLDLICEISAEFEKENVSDGYNYGTEVYVIPGFAYEFEKVLGGLEVGVGVPIGLTYESYDWGIITKVQYEF